MKRLLFVFLILIAFGSPAYAFSSTGSGKAKMALPNEMTEETKECVDCHKDDNNAMYQQWGRSKHYRANVGCYECHAAEKSEVDAFMHNGQWIATIVSPTDCSKCHEKEVDEFVNSHHSKAGVIMHGSIDNLLAEVAEGNKGMKTEAFPEGISAAAVNGCWQCHGSEVKLNISKDEDGNKIVKLDPATWPNSGIGRGNPDGSLGSCSACHSRHEFSVEQARNPENCGKCHMGPDHPQIEIYQESKHGIAYYANKERMNMDSAKWIAGEDYSAAPTCATCHMSATKDLAVTHNVGLRIKWNNRPPISKQSHITDARWDLKSKNYTGDQRRGDMKKVCLACHNANFADNFFIQYEALLDLYHDKFAKPGLKLYAASTKVLKALRGDEYAKFAQMIDFTWFELWHHEGRRARHAASMQGPDYTHWHGTYDLAKHWYGKYIPEIKELIEEAKHSNATAQAAGVELETLLVKIQNTEDHKWSIGKEDPATKAARAERRTKFLDRYK